MKNKFNHKIVVENICKKYGYSCKKDGANRYYFSNGNEHAGLLELIPENKKYFFTIYVNFQHGDDAILHEQKAKEVELFIYEQYKSQNINKNKVCELRNRHETYINF